VIVNAEAGVLPIADDSIHAAVTSPPYWGGLRVYDGEQGRKWEAISYSPMPGLPPIDIPEQVVALGHEPDPFAFVGHLLQVFREVRRVLRPDGCLAVNLGDCYSGGGRGPSTVEANYSKSTLGRNRSGLAMSNAAYAVLCEQPYRETGLASKNLILMPWRLALAMQADGWILRSRMPGGAEVLPGDDVGIEPDIVWRKKACMPESVRDRPTVDFEDVLIFSQEPRYFWDQEAGREVSSPTTTPRPETYRHADTKTTAISTTTNGQGASSLGRNNPAAGRNMRSVWTINPEPTDAEHFAAWPTDLAARLIRVLTSERGACPECGAPWVRHMERTGVDNDENMRWKGQSVPGLAEGASSQRARALSGATYQRVIRPVGFRPTCDHYEDFYLANPRSRKAKRRRAEDATGSWKERVLKMPGGFADPDADRLYPWPTETSVVLDPFAGLGRTWEACRVTGRKFVGTELALPYCDLAIGRNDLDAMARQKRPAKGATITGPLFEL
jgi:site-specific DNA-methyltransferase (cytosine-N4-specific)